MRGNEEGSCFLEKRPEQEDTRSSPSSSMELKFELDTQLTVSCVVAVALAFFLLILFVLFGWRELLGEFGKKRSAAK
jgi:hypothetical protein